MKNKFIQVSASPTADLVKMPNYFLHIIIAICVAPTLLSLLGVDFSSTATEFDFKQVADWPEHQQLDALYHKLPGAFTHALLEWTAFCTALFTVCLALSHYSISKSLATPVIGVALFLAGCMDAFHTLAAARLIEAVADNRDLIPFTWAICRVFNALILIGGVALLLCRDEHTSTKANLKFLAGIFVLCVLIAYGIINYCAVSETLPQTQFNDALITRPYDVVPLVLYLFAGLWLFPYFYRRRPSVFAHTLMIAMIPEVVVELHMAFGSSQLFDQHFNIAHFLKIIAYIVPLCGLLVDYMDTYKVKEREAELQKQAEVRLQKHTDELERSNKELDDFAYVASHDLKAPLRGVMQLAQWVDEDLGPDIPQQTKEYLQLMQNRVGRLEQLLDDLLAYSRVGRLHGDFKSVDLNALVSETFEMLDPPPGFELKLQSTMPTITTLSVPLEQVFRNLIGNAIKHHDRQQGKVSIGFKPVEDSFQFYVSDDGPGIPSSQHQRIFEIFKTLASRDIVEGSGIGLSIVEKLLDCYRSSITIESDGVRGTTFCFTWPQEPVLRQIIND